MITRSAGLDVHSIILFSRPLNAECLIRRSGGRGRDDTGLPIALTVGRGRDDPGLPTAPSPKGRLARCQPHRDGDGSAGPSSSAAWSFSSGSVGERIVTLVISAVP